MPDIHTWPPAPRLKRAPRSQNVTSRDDRPFELSALFLWRSLVTYLRAACTFLCARIWGTVGWHTTVPLIKEDKQVGGPLQSRYWKSYCCFKVVVCRTPRAPPGAPGESASLARLTLAQRRPCARLAAQIVPPRPPNITRAGVWPGGRLSPR